MKITIWSHFRNQSWTGEIPAMGNGKVFRYFNRVDDADCNRLAGIGYELPSLSAGDTFTVERRTFLVGGYGFIELTRYEHEQLQARSQAGEISMFDPALHRIEIMDNLVRESTNDDNDDGYADGEWVEWLHKFRTHEKALAYAGACRVGMSGVIVTVMRDGMDNGMEIR